MQKRLDDRPLDAAVPQLKTLRRRPPLAEIASVVASHFGSDPTCWTAGRRSADVSRAVAACLGRRFGYSATEVARALGYRGHGSVRNALARVESGNEGLQEALANLYRNLR